MMRRNFSLRKTAFISLLFSLTAVSSLGQDYSLEEAQKVLKAIETIYSSQFQGNSDVLKQIVITESELNSYIAYRIETEKEEIMRELQLKLFPSNRLEGKILIDLTGQKVPKFLPPCMTFYASGKIKVKDKKINLEFQKLFLEGQPVQPMILDLIIYIASKIEKAEAYSINDWYDLPYGIKDIKTLNGKAVFYY